MLSESDNIESRCFCPYYNSGFCNNEESIFYEQEVGKQSCISYKSDNDIFVITGCGLTYVTKLEVEDTGNKASFYLQKEAGGILFKAAEGLLKKVLETYSKNK